MKSVDIKIAKIENDRITWSRKFKTYSITRRFKFNVDFHHNKEIKIEVIINEICKKLEETIETIKNVRKLKGTDQIRFSFRNTSIDNEVYIQFMEVQYCKPDLLGNLLEKLQQSKKEALLNTAFDIDIITVNLPTVGGNNNKRKYSISFNEWTKNSTKIVRVAGDGNCLLRAFIVSKAHADKQANRITKEQYRQFREDTFKIQTNAVNKIISSLKIEKSSVSNIHQTLPLLQKLYENQYQIICVKFPNKIIFKGESTGTQIYILINDGHAHSLLSMTALLDCTYFCKICLKGHNDKISHKCNDICKSCQIHPTCIGKEKIQCKNCLLLFVSEKCLDNHINISKICGKKKYCPKCKIIYLSGKHLCGQKICKYCNEYVPNVGHFCFQKPLNKERLIEEDNQPNVFMFYDFECMVETEKNGFQYHKPNLCITQVVCFRCWDNEIKDKPNLFCCFCKGEQKVFSGVNTVENLLEYMFITYQYHLRERQKSLKLKKMIKIIAIAHNSRSYDSIFILKYCLENSKRHPKILKKGSKILSMTIQNIKFIDSLSFIPMALKKFSKTFGLSDNCIKGEFPHGFNTPDNWNYKGKFPELKYFYPDNRSESDRNELIKWHNSKCDTEFDFQKEIIMYCQQDVKVLMRSVMIFRDNWIKTTGLDCFTRSITLPMAVMESFKCNYLKSNQIAIIPLSGYEPFRKVSYIGQTWLDFLEKQRNTIIKREYRLGKYYADGFDEKTKEVYEFYGCYWHGCLQCYPSKREHTINKFNNKDMQYLYDKTLEKEKYYADETFKLIKIWECQFRDQMKTSKRMKSFFTNHIRILKNRKFLPPIEPRSALYGGRVNCGKLYHEVQNNEKIHYYDFTSLYPYCCKRKHFPIGHPNIIRNPETNSIDEYEGLIFCKILPPQNLYYAVLPLHINDQIIYTLCYQCAFEKRKDKCNHSNEQRSIIGTWVSIEIKLALEKGYRIMDIYEVWNFDSISGGEKNNFKGLFTDFINDCIKVKVESSGYPDANMSQEEKIKYIIDYELNENIELDISSIEINPGKRAVCKSLVNSFWGKLLFNLF